MQYELRDDNKYTLIIQIKSVLLSLVISISNKLIKIALYQFSKWEKHETYSEYIYSLSWRASLAQILNSCIIPFVSYSLVFKNDIEKYLFKECG